MKSIKGISLENFKRKKQKPLININEKEIESNLKNIILTSPIERRFQDFNGAGVSGKLFENLDEDFISNLETIIKEAIQKEEPRINLLKVTISTNTFSDSAITVSIFFKLIDEISDKVKEYNLSLS